MDIHAKGLIQKDVVEHKFIGDGRKGGKGIHLIIFTHADAGAKGTDFNRKEGKDSGESFMKTVWMD
ncbi:hypothetical protein NXV53_21025 [Bacteroides faecis]|nr:hypothetical protein [Bacteroides faecis]MCS3326903.1 hypothetical protein [Bacteroides faecis]